MSPAPSTRLATGVITTSLVVCVALVVVLLAVLLLHPASGLVVALAIAALQALLVLYALRLLGAERRAADELLGRVTAEQGVTATLEQRVAERTRDLDDAQRVLHRMWWLGQQITLELDPRRVLDRFLEAAADVAGADGAALGLLDADGTIEVAAASGLLVRLDAQRLPVVGSVMGRIIRSGGSWVAL